MKQFGKAASIDNKVSVIRKRKLLKTSISTIHNIIFLAKIYNHARVAFSKYLFNFMPKDIAQSMPA